MSDNYWWCPNCHEEVDPHCVTYQEIHDTCGYRVQWIENIPLDRLTALCNAEREGRIIIMRKCPNCGLVNAPGYHTDCHRCGARLKEALEDGKEKDG